MPMNPRQRHDRQRAKPNEDTGRETGMRHCALAIACGGEPVKHGQFHREITGWEKLRGAGGANQVVDRTETGRVACNACIGALRFSGPMPEAML